MNKSRLRKIADALIGIFYPEGVTCVNCGRELTDDDNREAELCKDCLSHITFLSDDLCPICADNLVDGVCNNCSRRKFFFDRTFTVIRYDGLARSMVIDFKDSDKSYLYRNMLYFMPDIGEDVDIVTYVPSSRKAVRRRGYDHAKILARAYARKCGAELLTTLERVRENFDSAVLTKKERELNLKGAFSVAKKLPSGALNDKTVVIVDDVMTTGYTMDECARILKKEGAKQVFAVVFAR